MSFRITEGEARALGYWKDEKGNWHLPSDRSPPERKVDIQCHDSSKVPKLESDSRDVSKGKNAPKVVDEGSSGRRYKIVVRAHYRRYVDHGNVCAKWFIDELVRAGIIPSDSNKDISDEDTRAVKVEAWEPETTLIEVFELTE